MNKRLLYILLGVLLVAFIGFIIANSRNAQAPSPSPLATHFATASPTPASQEILINLAAQNQSSQSGTVRLTEDNGKVKVALELTGEPLNASEPAHIHTGACPKPGAIKYPLTPVVHGKSDTTLDVDLKTLLSQIPLAINVHKSATQSAIYVACGDIQSQ